MDSNHMHKTDILPEQFEKSFKMSPFSAENSQALLIDCLSKSEISFE